jgi:hypothetical protein
MVEHDMAHDARFALLASMEHFTTQLQSGRLSEGQEAATRVLLENARLRWAYLEMAAAANGQTFSAVTSPLAPIAPTLLAAIPPAKRFPFAYAEALRPLLASLWRRPGSGPVGPGPWR